MKKNKTKTQLLLAWGSAISVLVILTAITYAWFSFNTTTNVEPISSTISEEDASLLIANTENGPFDTQCTLILDANPENLSPVSTSDLTNFYKTTAQNRDGISILYKDVTQQSDSYVIRGTVYLQSTGGANQVYFLPSATSLGTDVQALGALRLGMRITVNGQETTYLFQVDGLGGGGAESTLTVPTAGTVVSSINESGVANYDSDSSVAITEYMAVENGTNDSAPSAGNTALCLIGAEQVATVSYWIYLEGCDENCLTSVQSKDIPIQFGFAGVPQEGTS